MTFDDGILKIYNVENIAETGMKPVRKLILKSSHYFGFEAVGYSRYYTALQAKSEISNVLHIWQDRTILPTQICVLEDGEQYNIAFVQHAEDDGGLRFTRLTLERVGANYEYAKDI